MYNPEAKDLDILREYSPYQFALFSRYEFSPIKTCLEQVYAITSQRKFYTIPFPMQLNRILFPYQTVRPFFSLESNVNTFVMTA